MSFGHWLTRIRVHHLVLGATTLECDIWSRVEPHQTATLPYDFTCKVLQSNVVRPRTKLHTLICLNPKPNDALLCVSTNDQMIQSNVVPPIFSSPLNEIPRDEKSFGRLRDPGTQSSAGE